MQNLTDQYGHKFTLPASWQDVTTQQFCESDVMPTLDERATYFAGRPMPAGDKLDWMLTPPPTDGGLPYPADLGQESYLQVESIRTMLASQAISDCFPGLYGMMTAKALCLKQDDVFRQSEVARIGARCLDWPIVDTWPAVAHCLTELQRLATLYAELAEPDPTEAARRAREAGADELLGMFGHYNIATAVAQQMGITLDAAYQLPYDSVAIHLLHARRSAILADTIQRNSSKAHE